MNKIKTLALLLTVSLFTTFTSAKNADIRLKLTKGDVYTINMEMINDIQQVAMGNKMNIKQNMTIDMYMKVTDVLSNGNYKMEQSYGGLKMDMDVNGQKMTMDANDPNNEMSKPLAAMKDVIISFEVDSKGEVTNITGYEELFEKIGANAQVVNMVKGFANQENMSKFFSYIPKESVKTGDEYTVNVNMAELMNMEVKTRYKVLDITKTEINLDMNTDIKMDGDQAIEQNGMSMNMKATGTQTGTNLVSLKDGMPISSDITMVMEMEISMKNPQNGEDMVMPMEMNTQVKMNVTKE